MDRKTVDRVIILNSEIENKKCIRENLKGGHITVFDNLWNPVDDGFITTKKNEYYEALLRDLDKEIDRLSWELNEL